MQFSRYIFFILLFAQSIIFSSEAQHEDVKKNEIYSGHQTEEWVAIQNKLGQLKNKVDQQALLVQSLIDSKKKHGGSTTQTHIDELKKEHQKLLDLNKEYNGLLNDFNYRFPEKGKNEKRMYSRIENQSLEELEKNQTFEGRLKKLQKKIQNKFHIENNKTVQNEGLPDQKKHQKIPVGSKAADETSKDITDKLKLEK